MKHHIEHVDETVLTVLQKAGVSVKLPKCELFSSKVTYLGHIIRQGELLIDPVMVPRLKDALPPATQSELRSFLGLCNVYRRFVRVFSDVAAPLNAPLRKDPPAKFGALSTDATAAFEKLRDAVTSPPVLSLPTT